MSSLKEGMGNYVRCGSFNALLVFLLDRCYLAFEISSVIFLCVQAYKEKYGQLWFKRITEWLGERQLEDILLRYQ